MSQRFPVARQVQIQNLIGLFLRGDAGGSVQEVCLGDLMGLGILLEDRLRRAISGAGDSGIRESSQLTDILRGDFDRLAEVQNKGMVVVEFIVDGSFLPVAAQLSLYASVGAVFVCLTDGRNGGEVSRDRLFSTVGILNLVAFQGTSDITVVWNQAEAVIESGLTVLHRNRIIVEIDAGALGHIVNGQVIFLRLGADIDPDQFSMLVFHVEGLDMGDGVHGFAPYLFLGFQIIAGIETIRLCRGSLAGRDL